MHQPTIQDPSVPASGRTLRRLRPARLLGGAALCALALSALSGCTTAMIGGAAASAAATAAANKLTAAPQPPQPPEPKADPKEAARLRVELAALYLSRSSLGPALEEAAAATKLDPENAQAFNLLGLVNMQMKDDVQASRSFEQALRLLPNDPDINNNYGWYLCERGKHGESIKFFTTALRSPLYANADRTLVNAGVCSRRRGDEPGARRFFEQALSVRPNQPVALFNLADMAFAEGRVAEAGGLLDRYMQVAPPTPEVLWLGVRVERARAARKAEALYAQQLRRLFPNAPETQLLSQQGGQ